MLAEQRAEAAIALLALRGLGRRSSSVGSSGSTGPCARGARRGRAASVAAALDRRSTSALTSAPSRGVAGGGVGASRAHSGSAAPGT